MSALAVNLKFGKSKRKPRRISLGASQHTEPIVGNAPFADVLDAMAVTPLIAVQMADRPLPVPPPEATSKEASAAQSTVPQLPPRPKVDTDWNRAMIPLDGACCAHLRSLLRQALENSFLLPVPWEEVLLTITMNLAENIPRSLALMDNDFAAQAPSTPNTEQNHPRPKRFLVTLLDVEGDRPECSKFVHGQFDGRSLFRHNDPRSLIDPDVELVGGTIILHGDKRELAKATRIMELMAYAVCCQSLEMQLLRDHHAQRVREDIALAEHWAEVRDGIVSSHSGGRKKGRKLLGKDLLTVGSRSASSSNATSPTIPKRSNIWGWLVGRTPSGDGGSGTTTPKSPRDTTNIKLTRTSPFQAKRPPSSSSSSSTTKITVSRDAYRKLSSSTVSLELRGSNRFARIIHQMERAVLSTSPDVLFPPPYLMVRLRREEEEDEKADNEAYALSASASTSRLNSSYANGSDVLEQFLSVTALGSNNLGAQSSPFDSRRCRATVLSSRSTRGIAIDAKAGLSYLATNNNSLDGVFRHQSLTFMYSNYWSATAVTPCQPHELRTIDYFRYDAGDAQADRTLATFLRTACDESDLPCPSESCGRRMLDHIASYMHSKGRVNITLEETSQTMPIGIDADDTSAIIMWTQCQLCGTATPMVRMSPATERYSFAKYLELLFYSSRFVCHDLCAHSRERDSLVRYFRLGQRVVRFEYESIDLFEMRVPRIQVDPELALLPATRELLRRDDQPEPDETIQMLEQLRMEIAHFYGSAKRHITLLEEFTGVAACERGEGTLEQVCCQSMLEEMTTDFRDDEFALYEEARIADPCELNNVRRAFKIHAEAAMTRLSIWRKVHAEQCEEEAKERWDLPEYISSPLSHAFPESRVIVRENEPSSIISYTLSARMFQQALSELGTPPPTPDEEVARINGHYYYGVDGFDNVTEDYDEYEQTIHTATEDESDYGASVAATSYFAASTFNESNGNGTSNGDDQMRTYRVEGDDVHLAIRPWPATETYSPHLKMKFAEGNMRFSCTVYYAAQFDQLRRKCGVNGMFIQSLARCNPWTAEGGKSKSSFFKTHDDRLVVKQMLNHWTVAEKDALLKFAPSYFDYMDQSSQNPSVLAKIFGFYTVKYKNVHTGKTMKMDLLVMEHLFYRQKITRKFDLKGIPERFVDSHKSSSETLWDGNWVEGSYRNVLMTYGHSKTIIRESIRNDTRFLAESNVMDYSLLVGVDDQNKELVVGIVDFIGTFNWYKKMESHGKTTLRLSAHPESVTVVPPDQYKTRFRSAMEHYFLSVPDKWIKTNSATSQPTGPPAVNNGPTRINSKLPSVL